MSNLPSVFQALNKNSPSIHRTKHHASCRNIAMPMTSLYRTVFPTQKFLNTFFFVNCYNIRAVFTHILRIFSRNFPQFCLILPHFLPQFLEQNCRNFFISKLFFIVKAKKPRLLARRKPPMSSAVSHRECRSADLATNMTRVNNA